MKLILQRVKKKSRIRVIKNDENTKHLIVNDGDSYDSGWRKDKILNICL